MTYYSILLGDQYYLDYETDSEGYRVNDIITLTSKASIFRLQLVKIELYNSGFGKFFYKKEYGYKLLDFFSATLDHHFDPTNLYEVDRNNGLNHLYSLTCLCSKEEAVLLSLKL